MEDKIRELGLRGRLLTWEVEMLADLFREELEKVGEEIASKSHQMDWGGFVEAVTVDEIKSVIASHTGKEGTNGNS